MGWLLSDRLTIPANSSQRILVFIETHKTNAGAIASAADFEGLTASQAAEFLPSLTPSDFAEVVNYETPSITPIDSTEVVNDRAVSDSSGAFGFIGLTTMFGLLSVFRRKKVTEGLKFN